ncbi:MAG: S1C family serine protease [Acidimicrobiales bacterium]
MSSHSRSAKTAAATSTTGTSTTSTSQAVTASFSDLYKADNSGVVRITATSCGQSDIGTGFLVSSTMVATVAHVVGSAVTIGLSTGDTTTLGHVVGSDSSIDLALIETTAPLAGHIFTLASTEPPVGTTVGVIGFPLGGPMSFSNGTVSGLNRSIPIEGTEHTGLLQTDAPMNPGNSGGPVLLTDGTVIGLADAMATNAQGLGYAVPATEAGPLLSSWSTSPSRVGSAACSNPLGPSQAATIRVTDNSASADGPGIASALQTYFDGINTGDYTTAYNQLGPDAQAKTNFNTFVSNDASSFDFGVVLNTVNPTASGTDTANVTFTSLQNPGAGPHGESCDYWRLDYTMVSSGGTWLIEAAVGHNGTAAISCG